MINDGVILLTLVALSIIPAAFSVLVLIIDVSVRFVTDEESSLLRWLSDKSYIFDGDYYENSWVTTMVLMLFLCVSTLVALAISAIFLDRIYVGYTIIGIYITSIIVVIWLFLLRFVFRSSKG